MKRQFYFLIVIILPILVVLSTSCKKESKEGYLSIHFEHQVDGKPLIKDTMAYTNTAGNVYQVSEIQYFISEVRLYNSEGYQILIRESNGIHYVDTDIPETQTWKISEKIPAGTYDHLTFIFGITEEKNKTNLFTDPPESNMFWPDVLGGGYHYMKFNGKWVDPNQQVSPFNLHLGIGQVYDSTGNIISYVQNYFKVSPEYSSFIINDNDTTSIILDMNIASWFNTPHLWDLNVMGGMIMQNEDAMKMLCENGYDVFTFGLPIKR